MKDLFYRLRRYGLDAVFIGLPAAGALTCWILGLPQWMLVICLAILAIALISLLGDLGWFGGDPDD